MSERMWTEGPWEYREVGRAIGVTSKRRGLREGPLVARMTIQADSTRADEGRANARLIAAAPALVEALTEMLEVVIEALGDDHPTSECSVMCDDRYCNAVGCIPDKIRRARTALAAARPEGDGNGN